MDWNTSAAVFPGQGSQVVGMGADFASAYSIARDTFAQADEILGYSLSSLCWEGPADQLNQTINTQPALYVCSMAIWRLLQDLLPESQPSWVAGHSLGEFSALTAAGALSFEDGLRLVYARGSLMQRAGEENPGAMAAVLALDCAQVEELCAAVSHDSGRTVVLANDNCPGQAVVSGDIEAVDQLILRATEAGARRAVKLSVSVAAHSPLMATAQRGFQEALDGTDFSPPAIPVFGNVGARPLGTVADIRVELNQQLTKSVRWTDSMRAIIDEGAQTFVEVGAGNVLTGLMRRIDRSTARININTHESFERFLEAQAD